MSLWRSSGLRLEPMRTFLSGVVGDRDIHSMSSVGLGRGAERQHLIGVVPLLDGVKITVLNGCSVPLNCQDATWGRNFHDMWPATKHCIPHRMSRPKIRL